MTYLDRIRDITIQHSNTTDTRFERHADNTVRVVEYGRYLKR